MANEFIKRELGALTGLRFLAAAYVCLFHIQLRVGTPYLKFRLDNIVSQGALGVNLFFVLSGFLLAYSHLKDFPSASLPSARYYKFFLIKRFARIYPAYLAGLLAFLALTVWLGNYPKQFSAALVLDSLMLQSFVPSVAMVWYGGGGWSVSVELLFYLLFPFALPLLLRVEKKSTLLLILATLVVISCIPGFIHNLRPALLGFEDVYPFAFARLPEFLCGIITALLIFRFNWQLPKWPALALFPLFALYLMFFGTKFQGYTAHNFIAIPTIVSALYFCVTSTDAFLVRWLSGGFMKFMGKVSYCFYIMQLPLLLLLEAGVQKKVITGADQIVAPAFFIVNVLLAIALYYTVERPFHSLIINRMVPRKAMA